VERLAALGKITGTIAHELGTPLNSVLGYAQLLAQDNLPEGARRRTKIIETQIQRMVDIINNHLARTRGQARTQHPVNVNELVVGTIESLRPVFQQHRVHINTALADSLPLVRGDEVSLQRVLINLLDNAVDAMEDGGRVTVTTRWDIPRGAKQEGVIIEITDTGVGISPELLPKIFEFFVTTKAPGKGTGLGLPVCQEIIKGHGGTIEISSQVGNGTCVRIFLPIHERLGQSAPAGGIG
jgi:signal transduction histidine kinase